MIYFSDHNDLISSWGGNASNGMLGYICLMRTSLPIDCAEALTTIDKDWKRQSKTGPWTK